MNDLMARLLGLETLRFEDPGVYLEFARPIPAWGWLLAAAAAATLAAWSYWRLVGPGWARWMLAGGRALLLLLLLLLVCGPQLARPNDRVERDWVLVLVDRSASLTIPDVGAPEGRTTREAQLRGALAASWPTWAALAKDRAVVWLGFDSGIFDLKPAAETAAPGIDLREPAGLRTDIDRALEQALRRAAARPIAGIVILSDGRSAAEPSRAVLQRLKAESIAVYGVALGSAEPLVDLVAQSVEAPAMAFVNDTIPVRVRVERLGGEGAEPPAGVVRLVDRASGATLAERPLSAGDWAQGEAGFTFVVTDALAGKRTWRAEVVPTRPDLIPGNNAAEVSLELVDRPLRVLYLDGYPRWEQRYIRNLLVRETSIDSASLMLAADRRYQQEGDIVVDALPRSPEEWARFDVVVLGDMRSEMLTREQMEQLREHVAVRGAGLLWIGGPGATPDSWIESPLADLLPFVTGAGAAGAAPVRPWAEPVTMTRTPAAERLGLLALEDPDPADPGAAGWPSRLGDPATGWSMLRWAQRIEPAAVKPGAEVLATCVPESGALPAATPPVPGRGIESPAAEGWPIVLSMRFGAGRVLYVATDEVWRWRYARGETLPERFWLPLIRMQGRESLARSGAGVMLEVTPRRAEIEQPVRLAVRLLDQRLIDERLPSLGLRLRRVWPDPEDAPWAPVEPRLSPEDEGSSRSVSQTYAATWLAAEAGRYAVEPTDPLLSGMGLSATVEVMLPDDELRRPQTDHALLASLAQETGGQVLPPERLRELPDLLPNRQLKIAGEPDVETLWDKPAVLVLFMLLLTLEWVGRKLIRLA